MEPGENEAAAVPGAHPLAGTRLVDEPSERVPGPGKRVCDGDQCMATEYGTASSKIAKIARSTRLPRGSNSQLSVPRSVMFADVDGDAGSDILQYTANKLFVRHSDFAQGGMAHLYTVRPITRILTGDFSNSGRDEVCPILSDGSLSCYGLSPDGTDFWWWFTQGNMIGANEDSIVGDFDGDSRDDVLVYPRGGGAFRMYSVKGSAFFGPTPSFDQGNLSGVAVAGMRLRAGDFNGDGRADIMAVTSGGSILYYVSVWDGTRHTFWWAFTSNSVVGGNESVTTGRIDNNNTDDIVLHDRVSGATRFLQMAWNGGNPPPVSGVNVGQIANWGNADLSMIRAGGLRDAAMSYDLGGNYLLLAGAAAPPEGLTYWWHYTQYMPRNESGWAPFTARPWLLVKCKYRNETLEPHNNQWYRDAFTGDLPEYYREMTYGSYDLTGNVVDDTWYQMTDTAQDARNITGSSARWERIQRCFNTTGRSRAGFVGVAAVVNAAVDSGNQGDVLLDTWDQAQNTSWFAHETLHTFGLPDSKDDSTRRGDGSYEDPWDIMSANNIFTFLDWRNLRNGPEASAVNKRTLNLVPEHRKQILIEDPSRWITTTAQVAAINRPEANAPLFIEIRKSDGNIFTIEYRRKDRLDAGIPRATVMVHKRTSSGRSELITDGLAASWNAERLPGNTYSITGLGTLAVDSFAATGYTAQVRVTY